MAPEKGDWVDVRELSDGTLGQIYLAARLGLIRYATGDRRPPLDPRRSVRDLRRRRMQRAAFELLRELTADHQVIYLTSTDRYDPAADAVVELPGPTAVDEDRTERADGVRLTGRRPPRMDPQTAVVVLGLASAAAWGSADFGGGPGRPSRPAVRGHPVQPAGRLRPGARARRGPWRADPGPVGGSRIAVVAGVLGGIGIGALYGGLATGRMGVVAPISGVLSAVVPVSAGILLQGVPGPASSSGSASRSSPSSSSRRRPDDGVASARLRVGRFGGHPRRRRDRRSSPGSRSGLLNLTISRLPAGSVFGPLVLVRLVEATVIGLGDRRDPPALATATGDLAA